MSPSPPKGAGVPPLLTVKEVGARLGLSAVTVYALCAQGALPHLRIGNAIRFEEAAVARFVLSSRR